MRILNSTTFWVSLILPAINAVATASHAGIPWNVTAAGILAYGVKEAAAKYAARNAR